MTGESERGPTKREVDEAIASITGQPLPPLPPTPNGPYAAYLAGWLAMAVHLGDKEGRLGLKVRDVDIPTDADGNYLDHFIVRTDSGAEITVTITQKGGDTWT